VLSALGFHLVVLAFFVAATLFFVELARASTSGRSAAVLGLALGLELGRSCWELASGSVGAWSLRFALTLCATSITVAYLALRKPLRIHAMGVVVAPLALALIVGAEFVRSNGPTTDFPRTLLLMHISANVMGFGLFLLAGAASGFYLFQERRLKQKRVGGIQGQLPALDALDQTEHRLLLAGFPLLTFGIVTGAVFATRGDGTSFAGLARSAMAYATWLLVAGVLLLRASFGWRGRRAAYGTLAGVVCAILVVAIYLAHAGGGSLL
jgi:ABC-type uncharacterized transport system permease subunit